ncbi:MAG: ARPP-1 family domain-containing protein [Rubrobacter sp.]
MKYVDQRVHPLAATLEGLRLGGAVSQGALTLHPLCGSKGDPPGELDSLEDALRAGTLLVEEIGESGSVPELRVVNRGRRAVLILEGEELIGLKQNRTVNSSVLVGAGASVVLPVSCVERGRWSRASRLSRSTSTSHLALRRLKSRSVHVSLRARLGHRSDQRAVWDEVDRKSHHHGHVSETSALHDARLYLAEDLEGFHSLSRRLPAEARGVIVSIGCEPVALEILPDELVFARVAERLISGYALEALEYAAETGNTQPDDSIRGFVRRLASADSEEHATVGVGRDFRFEGDGLSGYALLDEERVLHAAAFVG